MKKKGFLTSVAVLVILMAMTACAMWTDPVHQGLLVPEHHDSHPAHSEQSLEHAEQVQQAEYMANLTGCLDGRYPNHCNHGILSPEHAEQVRQAEYQVNLAICLDGKYSKNCNHAILRSEHVGPVWQAEYMDNLTNCLDGRSPVLCNHDKLRPEHVEQVEQAEQTERERHFNQKFGTYYETQSSRYAPGCAENGSCYGDISDITGRPKTTYVQGYYRADGTPVRGHYRSR